MSNKSSADELAEIIMAAMAGAGLFFIAIGVLSGIGLLVAKIQEWLQ